MAVEPLPVAAARIGLDESEWLDDAASRADWDAWIQTIEPLEFTSEEEASFARFQATGGGGIAAYLKAYPGTALVKAVQRTWEPLLFCLALLTLAVDRSRWREFLPLAALPVSLLAVIVPIHLEGRYLLPVTQVWILFAAAPIAAWLLSDSDPPSSVPSLPGEQA